ncbi:MAG TPA: hypothetical protein VEN78_28290 [Bradyrhizobium sp.]|nr:hypothetical protein [Bradyrhizobium sp.]
MHAGTETNIKGPIAALFSQPALRDKLARGGQGARERLLLPLNFRSDFAFETVNGGWFFVEDDDPGRSLGNFLKYWLWAERHSVKGDISLVHLISRCDPGLRAMLTFLQEKAHASLPRFRSKFVFTDSWATEAWIANFRSAVLSLPPFSNDAP